MGTIGGGLSVADPSGCWPTSLRTLKTRCRWGPPARSIAIADFIRIPTLPRYSPGELVTEIRIPLPAVNTGSAYGFQAHGRCPIPPFPAVWSW